MCVVLFPRSSAQGTWAAQLAVPMFWSKQLYFLAPPGSSLFSLVQTQNIYYRLQGEF